MRRFGQLRRSIGIDGSEGLTVDDVEGGCAFRRGKAKLCRRLVVMREQEEEFWRCLGGDVGARASLAELEKQIIEHVGARRQRGTLPLPAHGSRSEGDVDAIVARDIERLPGSAMIAAQGSAIGGNEEGGALRSAARLSASIELHGARVLGAAGREQRQGVRRERAGLIPLAEHVDQLVDAAGALKRSDPHARLAAAFGARGKCARKQARKRRRGRRHRNLAEQTLDGARIEPAPEIGRKCTLALAAAGALPDDWRRCLKVRTPILGGRPRRRLRRRKVLIAGRRRLRPKVLIGR